MYREANVKRLWNVLYIYKYNSHLLISFCLEHLANLKTQSFIEDKRNIDLFSIPFFIFNYPFQLIITFTSCKTNGYDQSDHHRTFSNHPNHEFLL